MTKKLFCIALIIFVLTACNSDVALSSDTSVNKVVSTASTVEEASSTDMSDVISVNSTTIEENSDAESEAVSTDDTSSTVEKILTIDEAFEAYLKGEITATYDDWLFGVREVNIISHFDIGGDYALYDVTGDGVPELHLKSMGYEILMCQKRELVTIYESGTNGQHGPIALLENGAMLEEHTTFETMYTYTTFNADGTSNKTEFGFFENPEDETQNEYWFGEYDKKVTKEEFDELTKEYFAAAEKEAKLDWIEWTPPSNWEELRGY